LPSALELVGVCFGEELSDTNNTSLALRLENFHLSCHDGETLCLLGLPGSGRGEVLGLMAGYLCPDRGSILVDGRPSRGITKERALCRRQPSLFPWMNVLENVRLSVSQISPRATASQQRRQAMRHLECCRADDWADAFPPDLTPTQLTRVSLAVALALKPRVLLVDDQPAGEEEWEIIRRCVAPPQTAVVASCQPLQAIQLANRIALLSGRPSVHVAGIEEVPSFALREGGANTTTPALVALQGRLEAFLRQQRAKSMVA
jgi:NitT/TauT family transport system ATP-binding protein